MNSIDPSELSYAVFQGKLVVYYYRGQVVWRDELNKDEEIKSTARSGIQCILEGDGYDHARRTIREIIESRKFPLVYFDFNSYVRDWPEAERSRDWLTRGNRSLFIFQSTGHANCLPGGYLWMYISPMSPDSQEVRLCVNDNDDGGCCKDFPNLEQAKTALQEVLDVVPVNTFELTKVLGFGN